MNKRELDEATMTCMMTGGRILHQLRRFLPTEQNTVLLVGYPPSGTRGRAQIDGAEEIKNHGQSPARMAQAMGLRAHADHTEKLDWLGRGDLSPRKVFVTHGERSAASEFRARLREKPADVAVPHDGNPHALEVAL